MATENKKEENRLELTNLTLLSLAAGAWDTLGESVFALSGSMGDVILDVMEKEMGLEIAGENPQEVVMEIGRIFVDEFGFCSDIDVASKGDGNLEIKVKNCVNVPFTDKLIKAGVEKPFICPIKNACQAALRRMDFKMHGEVEKWVAGKGSIINFTSV